MPRAVARLGKRKRHHHDGHRIGERNPRDEERDIGTRQVALLQYREGNRRRAPGDDDRDQRRVPNPERVVQEQSDRNRRDRDHREGEHAASESLADCRRRDVNVRSGAEHQHRKADGAQHRERLSRGIDHTEPGVAENGTGDELADHDRDQPSPAKGEQRPGEPGEHKDRQLREHREIMPRKSALVSVVAATRSYEAWVGRQVPLVRADVAFKHEQMAFAPFPFLRSTFYRWVQVWKVTCPELADAPSVLAVGDLHTENFGTWRDNEGRLIWGINDFDEAFPMAYTNDLVRLATSAATVDRGGDPRAHASRGVQRDPRGLPEIARARRTAVRARRGAPRAPP